MRCFNQTLGFLFFFCTSARPSFQLVIFFVPHVLAFQRHDYLLMVQLLGGNVSPCQCVALSRDIAVVQVQISVLRINQFKSDNSNQTWLCSRRGASLPAKRTLNSHLPFVLQKILLLNLVWMFYFISQLNQTDRGSFETLIIQFLPSLTITILNIVVPQIFKIIVKIEQYTPQGQIKMNIFR